MTKQQSFHYQNVQKKTSASSLRNLNLHDISFKKTQNRLVKSTILNTGYSAKKEEIKKENPSFILIFFCFVCDYKPKNIHLSFRNAVVLMRLKTLHLCSPAGSEN